ncbi:MAG: hydantoinase B/oxoprolinase family protein, partial [Candidatus Eisenbacteria bacterium]
AGNVETSQRIVDVLYGALAGVKGLEVLEREYPLRVSRYSVRRGSGGRGRRRGGDGVVREIVFSSDCDVTILSDRRKFAPYGLRGGAPGLRGRNTLVRRGHLVRLPSKVAFRAVSGDALRIETPGGGGYGGRRSRRRSAPEHMEG